MISYIEEAELWKKKKEHILHILNISNLPVVLFGQTTAIRPDFLDKIEVKKEYILDNDSKKWGNQQWGLKIISPMQCPYKEYNVLILVPFVEEITNQLKQLPNVPQNIFYLDLYFESNDTAMYYETKHKEIETVYDILSDDMSKVVFQNVIRYRINRDEKFLQDIALPRNTQYFPKNLNDNPFLTEKEVFLDAGAFVGDTVSAFLKVVDGHYDSIYAFEPDEKNYKMLSNTYMDNEKIHCYQAGVGEKSEILHFISDTSGSKVSMEGTEQIQIVSLDELLGDIPVTYLKMDVEGMECAALRGATKLIQRYKPKLAICTYHSNSDMLEIPKLILEINPTYQLYFRHYTQGIVETVCYAL
nr:FkbM family methyltransferase [uncultured Butyricicoccus sp.]